MPRKAPTVLLTNDDGPPDAAHSMFVEHFRRALVKAGWTDVRVVVPSSQRSWQGKAYAIAETCTGEYFYPTGSDGYEGEKTTERRPLRDGESAEYVLLSSTPAACASIGIHNIHKGEIDLVLSGPNVGRNSSTAFALSSGTLGAALSAALSGVPAVALSYGIFERPPPAELVTKAHEVAVAVVKQLWEHAFAERRPDADLYTVNVPHEGDLPPVEWTTMSRTNYGRLFAAVESTTSKVPREGPQAISSGDVPDVDGKTEPAAPSSLRFNFKPDIHALLNPGQDELAPGTDNAAMHEGVVSVTPLQAAFAAGSVVDSLPTNGRRWKL